ncbi:MAG TPA: PorV/PorQ family protein [Ignavibacteriales bacterium]|nr:PorV/PorQ family protein [Ignavibacteriales bacterium]HPD66450.1 PorV/PorQ family protein [Ignavibacteriales bacterium]HPP34213.1 PorV/PorQ family protein [Ignavibacteriales bacterium]HRR19231.1 PorV/PorQ family protein [Ignavibacteriales bacterium]
MKTIKVIITIVVAFITAYGAGSISKSGTTAANHLKIGIGARPIGMGGAFTSIAGDINALYWNPGSIAFNQEKQVEFTHINWIADIRTDFFGGSIPVQGLGTFGLFIDALSMDEMMVRTIDKPEGTGEYFDANSFVGGIHYSRMLTDNFSLGFNAKYIRDKIWHMVANGFAVDVGVLYKIDILNEFRLAASITNYGTKMKMEGRDALILHSVGAGDPNLIRTQTEMEEWNLPLTFRFGISADLIKQSDHLLTVALDAVHPNDNSESLNLGMEYTYDELVSFRAGYRNLFLDKGEEGLTFGIGVKYPLTDFVKLNINYAYQDFGIFKNVQYFSVGVNF